MKATSLRRVASPLIALGLLATAACGSDDDTTTDDGSSEATDAPSDDSGTTETTATAADDPATTDAPGDGDTAATDAPAGNGDWDAIVAAAQAEGEVTVYSAQALDNLNNVAAAFEDEYGIKVNVFRGIDSDIQAKIQAERDSNSPIADVVIQATQGWSDEKQAEGWFMPVELPAWENPDYNSEMNINATKDVFVCNAAVLTFGWNTELWPDGLTDYTDLLNPELGGGQIGVIEPAVASIVDFWFYLEDNYGTEFIEQLAAQKPKIYPSSLPMGEALISGEVAAGSFVQVQDDFKADGAPVDSGFAPKVWGAIFQTSVLSNSPNPNAAQLLSNFILTPEGQELIAFRASSSLPNIEGTTSVTTDEVQRQDPSRLDADSVAAYQERWSALFQG